MKLKNTLGLAIAALMRPAPKANTPASLVDCVTPWTVPPRMVWAYVTEEQLSRQQIGERLLHASRAFNVGTIGHGTNDLTIDIVPTADGYRLTTQWAHDPLTIRSLQ